ncbi:MAG: hypothetical protein IPM21_08780 [Acidobacteria bacterium]|nr:hypothetical protein [Acidobacteriota bacterium]
MIPIKFEKIVRSATFQELWASREPDFKALNEIRTLKRHGISATHERGDDDTFRVIAQVTEVNEINYLVLKRGFVKVVEKPAKKPFSDAVKTILKRPRNGPGGGIPLTLGEVAMLFLDGYAGDHPNLLSVYSKGYGEGPCWHGLTPDDVLEDANTAFVWTKWEPIELWNDSD